MAIQLARTMGTGKVIGISRNETAPELELDERTAFQEPAHKPDFRPRRRR